MSSHSPSPSASPSPSPSPSDPCAGSEPRVTASHVRCIMSDLGDVTDEQIDCFIQAAHVMIENTFTNDDECVVNDCTLFTLEQWLAAHFVSTADPSTILERYGDAQDNFGGVFGLGFDGSRYGQQVMRLDPCGKLSDKNEKDKIVTRKLIFQARGR